MRASNFHYFPVKKFSDFQISEKKVNRVQFPVEFQRQINRQR